MNIRALAIQSDGQSRSTNFAFGEVEETRDAGEGKEGMKGKGVETRRRRRFSAVRVNGESAT